MSKRSLIILLILLPAVFLPAMETGGASWYGGKFQGRLTANGEIFDTNKFTAAHKTLPFNTIVEVTDLHNGKKVYVRINDRGPFVAGRVIDLSRAAAEKIGLVGKGVTRVRLRVVSDTEKLKDEGLFDNFQGLMPPEKNAEEESLVIVQIASYSVLKNAERTKDVLTANGLDAQIEETGTGYYRVIITEVPHEELEKTESALKNLGFHSILVRKP